LLNEIDDAEWAEMGAKGPPRSRLLAAQAAAMRGDDAKTYALAAAQVAEAPFSRFRRWSAHARQPWAMAVAERCRALISTPEEAEARYVTAVRLHSGSGRPFEEARTRLLYGEWLRRDLRRTEARSHLRAALDTFERLEAAPWIDRARNELRATGEIAPPPRLDRLSRLTPQELQVIRLAATGATNREIGGRLFLSPRTVSYHLYKAYPKLGVSSRRELVDLDLDRALVDNPRSVPR
jgi:DNA-binding CsgD family transcriptional regulator